MKTKRVIFSGIKPTGDLHIGNYLGAIKHWAEGQKIGLNIFCIVDLHAITVDQDPIALKKRTFDLAAWLIACGIDPEKSLLFIQSHNPDHANLGWVLNCFVSMGQLSRMTQYKEKSYGRDFVSVGLFDYPALMAADILLYDTTHVPVGEDQKQHVELTRDIAERFNTRFGQTFVLPEAVIPQVAARIASLTEPSKKMSKSEEDPMGTIDMIDDAKAVTKKILSAVTDSGSEVKYDLDKKPGISNLIEIYTQVTGRSIKETEEKFEGKGYGEFKEAVAESVISMLLPIQKSYKTLRESKQLQAILTHGAKKAAEMSHKKLLEVYEKVGFVKLI